MDAADHSQSRKQPVWHFIVLTVSTMLAYWIYWFYKTWRDLKRQAETLSESAPAEVVRRQPLGVFAAISPGLRTLFMLVPLVGYALPPMGPLFRGMTMLLPLLNIYLAATLVLAIANLHPDSNSFPRRLPLLATTLVVGACLFIMAIANLPYLSYAPSLLGAAPFCFVQHWLNQYWDSLEVERSPMRQTFTPKETIVIALGSLWLALVAIGIIIGVHA